jgi:hypothetical protein
LVTDFFGLIGGAGVLQNLEIDAIPPQIEHMVLQTGIWVSAVLEALLPSLASGTPINVFLSGVKSTLDSVLPNKAGSDIIRKFSVFEELATAFFANTEAPTPETAIGAATKAVAIKLVVSAPPTIVLTAAEWESIQAARAQTTTNAEADAPLIPLS